MYKKIMVVSILCYCLPMPTILSTFQQPITIPQAKSSSAELSSAFSYLNQKIDWSAGLKTAFSDRSDELINEVKQKHYEDLL